MLCYVRLMMLWYPGCDVVMLQYRGDQHGGLHVNCWSWIKFRKNRKMRISLPLLSQLFLKYAYVVDCRKLESSSLIKAELEWPSGLQRRVCGTDGRGFEPPNFHQCSQTCLQVCGSKGLGCHADLYTVSRCCTRGESEEFIVHRRASTQARESTLALKPRADITRSPK